MDQPERSDGSGRLSRIGAHAFVTKVATYGLGFVTSVLIARALGPAGRGRYFLPVTAVTIAFYLANMGLQQAQFRTWSQRRIAKSDYVTLGFVYALILGTIGSALLWLVFSALRETTFVDVRPEDMVIVVPLVPFLVHSLLTSGLLTSAGAYPATNNALLAGAVTQLAGTAVLFALDSLTVRSVLILFAVSTIVPWAYQLPRLVRLARPRARIPWSSFWHLLRIGVQIEPYILFMYLNLRLDVFFIARYSTLAAVGIYSIAVILSELVWLATDSIGGSVYERQFNAPTEEAMDVTTRAVRMSVLTSVALGAAIGLVAHPVIVLLYGDAFSEASKVVWLLLPAALAMAVWRPTATALIRFAAPWVQPLGALAAISVNVVGNIILVPRLGISGAAIASTLSYGGGAVISIGILRLKGLIGLKQLIPGRAELQQLRELLQLRSVAGEIWKVFRG